MRTPFDNTIFSGTRTGWIKFSVVAVSFSEVDLGDIMVTMRLLKSKYRTATAVISEG